MIPRRHPGPRRLAALCLAGCVAAFAQLLAPAVFADTPVTWVFFVDDLHLDFRNTGRIRNTIKTIASELIQEGDRFAIASCGPSRLAVDVTVNRQLLDGAIQRATGNGLNFDDVMEAGGDSGEVRYRVSTAVAAAQELLNNLARLPAGPVAVLYVSNGYSFDLLPDRAATSRSPNPRFDVTRAEVLGQLQALTATARRASIRIFAIDPRAAFDDPSPAPSDPRWPAHRSAMQSALQSVSAGSGGFAIVDGDFDTQLRNVADAMRSR